MLERLWTRRFSGAAPRILFTTSGRILFEFGGPWAPLPASPKNVICLDRNGTVLWRSDPRQSENASLVSAGRIIFSLEEDGELVVLRASRTAMDVVRRYTVATSASWAAPTISGNRIYVKDVSTLALWTLD